MARQHRLGGASHHAGFQGIRPRARRPPRPRCGQRRPHVFRRGDLGEPRHRAHEHHPGGGRRVPRLVPATAVGAETLHAAQRGILSGSAAQKSGCHLGIAARRLVASARDGIAPHALRHGAVGGRTPRARLDQSGAHHAALAQRSARRRHPRNPLDHQRAIAVPAAGSRVVRAVGGGVFQCRSLPRCRRNHRRGNSAARRTGGQPPRSGGAWPAGVSLG